MGHFFSKEGYEVAELLESRQLVIADAEDVVATFFLDEQRFQIGIGSLIDKTRAGCGRTQPVRVFDEMVDLIWISNLHLATGRTRERSDQVAFGYDVVRVLAWAR